MYTPLPLILILSLSFFYIVVVRMRPSAAPLASCSTVILLMTLFGCLGCLSAGVVVLYLLGAALLVCSVIRIRQKELTVKDVLNDCLSPSIVFFIISSVVIYIVCFIKQPAFRQWDEFSFWGIAAKVIWSCRELYTTAGTSMITSAYLPGLPLFGAFFQYFSAGSFTEYKVYIAYDVLMIASLITIFGDTRWKDWLKTAVTSVFCICFMGLFSSCYGMMNPMFSAYSDTVIGLVFGGIILTWFMYRDKDLSTWLATCLGLALLTCLKDIGLALDFIIAGTISLDMVIGNDFPHRFGKKKFSVINLIYCAAMFIIPVVVYVSWLKYFTAVTNIVSSEIPYPYSFIDIVIRGKDPRFFMFVDYLKTALDEQLVNFGSIKFMSFVFVAYPIVAICLLKDKKLIVRTSAASICMFFGFVVYNIFFLYLYTAVFHYDILVNYQRYMSSYVIGWGLTISGLAAIDYSTPRSDFLKKLLLCSYMILISVCAVFFRAPLETDVSISDTRLQYQHWYSKYCSDMTVDDRMFLVCQDSDGGEWMVINYDFLPVYTVPTYVTGNLIRPGSEHHTIYDVEATSDDIVNYLKEEAVDYVIVLRSNEYFLEEFGKLFSDDLGCYYDGSCNFYKVDYNDAGSIILTPVISSQ